LNTPAIDVEEPARAWQPCSAIPTRCMRGYLPEMRALLCDECALSPYVVQSFDALIDSLQHE
jgi:hypothetical protein